MKLSEAALEGQVLQDTYKIHSRLGQGGMAWVYKGEHLRLQTAVAVKVLSAMVAADTNNRVRFLREARIQYELHHTHIVRVLDTFEANDLCCIVLEWCNGGDLYQWYKERGKPIGPAQVQTLLLPIVDGLAAAHANGVVHRDLKPQNILLQYTHYEESKAGTTMLLTPKLTDFGVAKELGSEEGPTVTGSTVGTIRYISPEQLRDSKRVDHRSDIYSFGAMLYLMLTGHHAFQGQGPEVLTKILTEDDPFPGEAPAPFQPILLKCLQKDPMDRYQSCGELREALLDALAATGQAVTDRSVTLPTPAYLFTLPDIAPYSASLALEDTLSETESKALVPRPPNPLADETTQRKKPQQSADERSVWMSVSLVLLLVLVALLVWGISQQGRSSRKAHSPSQDAATSTRQVPQPVKVLPDELPKPTPPIPKGHHPPDSAKLSPKGQRTKRRKQPAKTKTPRKRRTKKRPKTRTKPFPLFRPDGDWPPPSAQDQYGELQMTLTDLALAGYLWFYHKKGNKKEAASLIKHACDEGFLPACVKLGLVWIKGHAKRALPYFKRACQDGYGRGCWYLGMAHTKRFWHENPLLDKVKSCLALRQSCDWAYKSGCEGFNRLKCSHETLEFDTFKKGKHALHMKKGLRWTSVKTRGAVLANLSGMSSMQVYKDKRKRRASYLRTACRLSSAKACWSVGLEHFRSVPGAALFYFKRACSIGHASACARTGLMYGGVYSRFEAYKNQQKACAYFQKACKLDPNNRWCGRKFATAGCRK